MPADLGNPCHLWGNCRQRANHALAREYEGVSTNRAATFRRQTGTEGVRSLAVPRDALQENIDNQSAATDRSGRTRDQLARERYAFAL